MRSFTEGGSDGSQATPLTNLFFKLPTQFPAFSAQIPDVRGLQSILHKQPERIVNAANRLSRRGQVLVGRCLGLDLGAIFSGFIASLGRTRTITEPLDRKVRLQLRW